MTMRGAIGGVLAGTLLLTACTLPNGGALSDLRRNPDVRVRATPSPTPTPSPEAEASGTPAPTPTATATPTPTVSQTPSVPMRLLSGLVKIDANYIISTGGGNIIAAGGGNIIAAGGGNIIAAGGGNIIAAGGGNIISTGGGNIISTGGGNYRTVLETASLPVGTMLPVKGMGVVAVSLTTGKPIGPMVKTDEKGEYQVPVPESAKDNVLIFSAFPSEDEESARNLDPRLRYGAVVSAKDTETITIDEDQSLLARYTLTVFTGRVTEILEKSPETIGPYIDGLLDAWSDSPGSAALIEMVRAAVLELHAEGTKAGVPGMAPDAQRVIGQRVADALVAHAPLKTFKINP
ncbi:MAG: hypothetical protein ACLGG9_07305, partial [Thermoleophilia bacterium]